VKRLLILVILVIAVASIGCGGDSPTAPSVSYPSLVGGWIGTYTSNLNIPNVPGGTASGGCTLSWTVTSEGSGQFSGTWQLTGGFGAVTSCASSGALSGVISSSGSITSLSFATTIGAGLPAGCSQTSSTGYTGIASSASVNASSSERYSCPTLGASLVEVGRVISLMKR
jgi:hypothetical protein